MAFDLDDDELEATRKMHKGSDINVGTIEEDIERLNKLVTTKFINDYSIDNVDKEAIEHLLQDYKRQKQINEEHQKINEELKEILKKYEHASVDDIDVILQFYQELKKLVEDK